MKRNLLIGLMLLCLVLCSCRAQTVMQSDGSGPSVKFEGGTGQREAVIQSAEIQKNNEGYEIILSFARSDGLSMSDVPRYILSEIENPYRLILSGDFVADDLDQPQFVDQLCCYTCKKDGLVQLVMQTDSHAYFSVKEEQNRLTVTLSPMTEIQNTASYRLWSTFDDSSEVEKLAENAGMHTAFLRGQKVYLADQQFADEESARAEKERWQTSYDALGIEIHIESLEKTAFGADLLSQNQLAQIERNKPMLVSSELTVQSYVACWVYGAAFLCEYDANASVFAKKDEDGSALWLYRYDGNGTEIENTHCNAEIQIAVMSRDGKFLAFADNCGKIYSMNCLTGSVQTVISETAIDSVLDMTWGDDGSIYVLANCSDEACLLSGRTEEQIKKVELPFVPSVPLESGGGMIFLMDDQHQIRLLAAQNNLIDVAYPAEEYLITPDGSQLVCVVAQDTEQELQLRRIGEDQVYVIAKAPYVSKLSCSSDGMYLHFQKTDEQGAMCFSSYRFVDKKTVEHGLLSEASVFAMPSGWIGLVCYTEDRTPVTYRMHLDY